MDNMIVSVNPHVYAKDTTQTIMRDVLIALFPAVIASIVFFGVQALLVEVVCVVVAVACEWAFEKSAASPSPSWTCPPPSPACCWPLSAR